MTLVPFNKADIEAIKVNTPKNEDVTNMLISFIESEHDCLEVIDYHYKDAFSCRSTIHTVIRHLGLLGIKVRMRGRRVFLIKEQ